jgi:hypothetical protein
MRSIAILILVMLTGCATSNSALIGYCSVLKYVGELDTPRGLITLDPVVEAQLRQQLPPETKNAYICWYTAGDQLIAGGRRNSKSFNYGRLFNKQSDGTWKLSDEPAQILDVPDVIN